MDTLSDKQRHKNMCHIRSKDTKIELILRKALWHQGFRYRKNFKGLPGKPDIVLTKYKIVIFCDSEFWHGKSWDEKQKRIQTNRDYWLKKISGNMVRDVNVDKQLTCMGWTVLRFWGEDIIKNTDCCIHAIKETIFEKELEECTLDDCCEDEVQPS